MTKGTLSSGSKTVVPRPPTFRSRPMTTVATLPGRRGNVTGVAKATVGTPPRPGEQGTYKWYTEDSGVDSGRTPNPREPLGQHPVHLKDFDH